MIITGDDSAGIRSLQHFVSQHFEMKDLALSAIFLGLRLSHPLMETIFPKLNIILIFSPKPVSSTTKLFPLPWNIMQSSHPWMVNLYPMLFAIISWLVV